jgi:hypothetical protein
MKKTILVVALAFVAFVAVASVTDPAAHNNTPSDSKSRIYYFVHPYIAYHTYTVAPVVYYPRYYAAPVYPVYPVYRVYPVYTYQYWYNRFAAPKQNAQQVLQGSGSDVKVERPADIKK